jgi:hypothetical protein
MQYYVPLIVLLMFATSCVHEPLTDGNNGSTEPPPITNRVCSTDTVYFVQTIMPLVTSLCGKSDCHGAVNPNEFQLIYSNGTEANNLSMTYAAIKGRFVSSSSPISYTKLTNTLADMASKNQSGYVPPDNQQLQTLKSWIAQGAQLNSCNGCDTTKFSFTEIIQPILSTYCTGCHNSTSASASVDLSTYNQVNSEISTFPGRLVGAIEWTPPYTGNKAMPYGGSKMPDCYIKQIKKWIDAGAPND